MFPATLPGFAASARVEDVRLPAILIALWGDMGWIDRERASARLYARAVMADPYEGDQIVRASLAGFDPESVSATTDWGRRLAVFRALFEGWQRMRQDTREDYPPGTDRPVWAQGAGTARQILLLVDVLGLMPGNAAELLKLDREEAGKLLAAERKRIQQPIQGRALIVEDEFVVAIDAASFLEGMGLSIVGIARSKSQAVEMAQRHRPDLLLMDYDLGGENSGLEAVKEISSEMPVIAIFLTAFPDEVLEGEVFEPAFVLTKPFRERALRAAVVHGLEMTRTAKYS